MNEWMNEWMTDWLTDWLRSVCTHSWVQSVCLSRKSSYQIIHHHPVSASPRWCRELFTRLQGWALACVSLRALWFPWRWTAPTVKNHWNNLERIPRKRRERETTRNKQAEESPVKKSFVFWIRPSTLRLKARPAFGNEYFNSMPSTLSVMMLNKIYGDHIRCISNLKYCE